MIRREPPDETRQYYLDYLARCGQVFAPFAPIELPDFFAGRKREVERLIDAVGAPGQQIAILGMRGVGKTSLAALAYFFVRRSEDDCSFVRCTNISTFDSIFSEALADVGVVVALNGMEASHVRTAGAAGGGLTVGGSRETRATYRALAPLQKITPRLLLQQFADRDGLIVVDEYDRVQDPATHTQLAELLKHFSDARSRTKLVVVGVAETLSQLVGEHESLTRCLGPIRLDPMDEDELREILRRGEERLGVVFTDTVKCRIVRLADGFPHFVHLLARSCAQAAGKVLIANRDARPVVADEGYHYGLRSAVEDAQPQLVEDYERAIVTVKRKSEKFELVLWAMALSSDRRVQVGDVAANAGFFTGDRYANSAFSYHLGELVKKERSCILTRVNEGFYRFTNPLMRPYIRLRLELENVLAHGGQLSFPFMKHRA